MKPLSRKQILAQSGKHKPKMSAKGRAAIAKTQRERWAKIKAKEVTEISEQLDSNY
jgi:hypothetical protein